MYPWEAVEVLFLEKCQVFFLMSFSFSSFVAEILSVKKDGGWEQSRKPKSVIFVPVTQPEIHRCLHHKYLFP